MPAVVDAFKNLIRKHHHHRHPDSEPQPYTASVPESSHQPQNRQQQQQQQQQELQQQAKLRAEQDSQKHQQPEKQYQPENIPQPEPAPDSRHQQINMTAPEDREPRIKLPTYKGLDNFKLLDKMGDGAFSNVYKAADLTTGQTVAGPVLRFFSCYNRLINFLIVKVVRKFELNASQVSKRVPPPLT
ncbi:hypothetical protein BDR03DRAFT_495377 [Suillus americanus]|nr:hypothetical protein BDR03DRAFT_495377 [Suillus americanus]